jgi:glycosyltransferase involved in cell wall biosynthesis
VLGFVGSFYAYEGLDLLLDAFPALLHRRPELRLLLVGGGPQDDQSESAGRSVWGWRTSSSSPAVCRISEVSRYYDQIDLLAYPRHSMRLTELVTPLKPLEAMAQGRLFVASDVGGHKELIRDGETGTAVQGRQRSTRWLRRSTACSLTANAGPRCAWPGGTLSRTCATGRTAWPTTPPVYRGLTDKVTG